MAKEFIYTKVKELGTLGDSTVEVGYYTVDGKKMVDKVYMVSHFTRKLGVEDSKTTVICNLSNAKDLAKILMEV